MIHPVSAIRSITVALGISLCAISLHANSIELTQSTQDLSGSWDFRLDPASEGEQHDWSAITGHPQGWQQLHVPGSPNVQLSNHPLTPSPSDTDLFYKGAMWYHTTFTAAPDPRLNTVLHLSSVVLRNKVWLNGHLAGQSSVPYQDVPYDISALLHSGPNDLVIEVDNRALLRAIPDAKWRGWWDDGGLIGPVTLVRRPIAHADTFVTTSMLPANHWQFALDTTAHQDPSAPAILHYTLTDDRGIIVWKSDRKLTSTEPAAHLVLSADLAGIHPWSPEHPNLYRLTVVTAGKSTNDTESFRVGFRQIETRGTQMLLNGEPITLRGINRHQFFAAEGMTLTREQNRTDMADLKNLGANFTRLAHYSQSQDVYDACDEFGLLIWTEIPAWQTAVETLADPGVWKDDAAPQLTAMVAQHRNHASVVIYSVANEIPTDKPQGAAYIEKAINFVRDLDNSRLITFASDKREKDLALGFVDVIAVNEYFGWYYGKLSDVGPMLDMMHAKYPSKPILVSEYGSESLIGWNANPSTRHPDSKGMIKNYSTTFQVDFLTAHMQQIYAPQRRGYVVGGTIWVYNDFPDPHRVGGDEPAAGEYRNCKGLVTMDRQHKPAYNTVHAFYHQLSNPTTNSPTTGQGFSAPPSTTTAQGALVPLAR